MRLIDADALMLKICGEGCGCMPDQCGYPYCGKEGNEIRCRTGEYVENAPAIPAIPVEWLRTFDLYYNGVSGGTPFMNALVEAWKREQEAQHVPEV